MIKEKYRNFDLLIMGDFNLAKCYFTFNKNKEMQISTNNKNNNINENAKYLYINLKDMSLLQYNNLHNIKSNILDLIFSNLTIEVNLAIKSLVKVDVYHAPLAITLKTQVTHKKIEKIKIFNYKKANYENIFDKLNRINWNNKLNNKDINTNTNIFYEILNKIIQEEVPKTLLIKDFFPKFFSKNLKRLIKIKKIYQKKFKSTKKNKLYHYRKFNKHRKYCKYIYNLEYNKYIEDIEHNLKNDQKPFWYYINETKKNQIPTDMIYKDKIVETDTDIANSFANFFQSTYSTTNVTSDTSKIQVNNTRMDDLKITEADVVAAIKRLKPNQSAGYDNIHPSFLKNCCSYLSAPLKLLFNQSIEKGTVPDIWKYGLIIPIYKKGEIKDITNYRPITIL